MQTQEYNGWKNRETWATNLWIENDEGLYNEAQELAKQALRADKLNATRHLADLLENWFDELFNPSNYGELTEGLMIMRNDIGSLYRVDWWEIASNMVTELELQSEEVEA